MAQPFFSFGDSRSKTSQVERSFSAVFVFLGSTRSALLDMMRGTGKYYWNIKGITIAPQACNKLPRNHRLQGQAYLGNYNGSVDVYAP